MCLVQYYVLYSSVLLSVFILYSSVFCLFFFFFFFQAEDGIRDWSVTGVQTCALPICIYLCLIQRSPPCTARPGAGLSCWRAAQAGACTRFVVWTIWPDCTRKSRLICVRFTASLISQRIRASATASGAKSTSR